MIFTKIIQRCEGYVLAHQISGLLLFFPVVHSIDTCRPL